MKTPKVSVYIRTSKGYTKAPKKLSLNHKLQDGESFYLRFSDPTAKKQTWEAIGTDASLVADRQRSRTRQLEDALSALAKGEPIPVAVPTLGATVELISSSLADAIATYLADCKARKLRKGTLAKYARALRYFLESCQKTTPQDINLNDLKAFVAGLRKGGEERHALNMLNATMIFLRDREVPFALALRLNRWKETPRPAKKKPTTFTDEKWAAMLFNADEDEADLLHFLEGMGTRGGEAKHAPWTHLDLNVGQYMIAEYEGWQPKDKDARIIELTDDLVARMRARRARYPTAKLIFAGPDGLPNLNILSIIKELALRSKVNCGNCHSKSKTKRCTKHPECKTGRSCLHHPVCFNVIAHKTRKRYTAKMLREGVDPTSIMLEAGWSSFETMKNYMADLPNPGLRAKKNRAFASV